MKLKLSFFLNLFVTLCFSQSPINSYSSIPMSTYYIVTSSPALDQSATGANINWNFNTLTSIGSSLDEYATPTAAELTSYPGSTSRTSITSTIGAASTINKIFTKNIANTVSITAVKGTDLELNYATNNALIGAFPLNYGYSNTDATSGTYNYTTYSGTFSGTITTSVDAYGTLSANVGSFPINAAVTRLKTVQNISINNGFFTNVGTITQTSYSYYNSSSGNIYFRNTTVTVNVPLLSINQTSTQIESFNTILLGIDENEFLANQIKINPNPVAQFLTIDSNLNISLVAIFDLNGREILQSKSNQKSIPVDNLQAGIYLAKINSDQGVLIRKFIKN